MILRLDHAVLGGGRPFFLTGPCVLENRQLAFDIAGQLKDVFAERELPFVFKASYDKANRSSLASGRGPGMEEGLGWLQDIRSELEIGSPGPAAEGAGEAEDTGASPTVGDASPAPASHELH